MKLEVKARVFKYFTNFQFCMMAIDFFFHCIFVTRSLCSYLYQ